jgi:hypothetical protein
MVFESGGAMLFYFKKGSIEAIRATFYELF